MYLFFIIYSAYIADLVVGDPYWFPHPVIYIGKFISFAEKKVRKSNINKKIGGFLIWILTISVTALLTASVLFISHKNKYVYFCVSTAIICTSFSTKCLAGEAKKIYDLLKKGDIESSRRQLSYIVGRDTTDLDEHEIIRATVETVAENTVDGTISPMLYAFIGGPIGAMIYKAVNTMDSMIGYKNERYREIGMCAAKLDDIFNWIPARISIIFFSIASIFMGYDFKSSIKIAIRDRKNHKSPNCAYPEGAVAGSLGIQLGGTNIYFGEKVFKPTIGDRKRELEADDIKKVIKLLYLSTFICLVFLSLIYYFFISI